MNSNTFEDVLAMLKVAMQQALDAEDRQMFSQLAGQYCQVLFMSEIRLQLRLSGTVAR